MLARRRFNSLSGERLGVECVREGYCAHDESRLLANPFVSDSEYRLITQDEDFERFVDETMDVDAYALSLIHI